MGPMESGMTQRVTWVSRLVWLLIPLAVGGGYWWGRGFGSGATETTQPVPETTKAEGITTRVTDGTLQIVLPSHLARSKSLARAQVNDSDWNDDRTIPAKLELDPGRHYAVPAPADVIVEELLVPLGERVLQGNPLVEMSTSQITTLRAEVDALSRR